MWFGSDVRGSWVWQGFSGQATELYGSVGGMISEGHHCYFVAFSHIFI